MGDVLSQSEVESLLAALDPHTTPSQSAKPQRRNDPSIQLSLYDFKRPERVSKEQMRAFQALHEGFSREFGAALSGMLRAIVEVKLISVDQLTYSEFVFSLENPTCFNLLESNELDGHLILDLNPSIIFPIIDRLLGGGKQAASYEFPNRPLTEIELQLVSRITALAIQGLQNSWANIAKLKLRVSQVESNPQLVQIVPPNEVVVLISFEISMGESRGIMNLCIPFNTIEPLSGKLTSDSWSAYSRKQLDSRQKLNLETGLGQAAVRIVVHLARTQITTGELAGLEVGDVIMTETGAAAAAQLLVEGTPMFEAFPGTLKGHKAIRVGKQLVRPRELIEQELGAPPPTPPKK